MEGKPVNPWLSIWVHPRRTMAEAVKMEPNRGLFLLSAINGFLLLLNLSQRYAFSSQMGFWGMILLSLVLSPLVGYLYFSVASWFVLLAGKCFRGKATFRQCRAAMAWSCVPLIVNVLSWIIVLVFFQGNLSAMWQRETLSLGQTYLILFLSLAQVVFGVWSLILFFYNLSEMQGFSVIKAIGSVVVAWLFFALFMIILWLLAMLLGGNFWGKG